jgi:hypothetical protein
MQWQAATRDLFPLAHLPPSDISGHELHLCRIRVPAPSVSRPRGRTQRNTLCAKMKRDILLRLHIRVSYPNRVYVLEVKCVRKKHYIRIET